LPASERGADDVGSKLIAAPRGGSETVLVAEDDEMVRAVVVRILSDAGYRVLTAKDGVEASECFASNAAADCWSITTKRTPF
jgi:PleD family two-component response regulator